MLRAHRHALRTENSVRWTSKNAFISTYRDRLLAYSITGIVYAGLMFWASDRVFPVGRSYVRLGGAIGLFVLASAGQTWTAAEH